MCEVGWLCFKRALNTTSQNLRTKVLGVCKHLATEAYSRKATNRKAILSTINKPQGRMGVKLLLLLKLLLEGQEENSNDADEN